MVKKCFGHMDNHKTGDCSKCKLKTCCYGKTFDKLIHEGQLGVEGEIKG